MMYPPDAEPSIRSELLSIERLEQEAERLAGSGQVSTIPGNGRDLARRLRDNGRALVGAYRDAEKAVREERAITPADKWLLDNFYIAQQQIREVRDDFPRAFSRGLPSLAVGPLEGHPRVFGLAWALVAHTDSRVDRETLVRFVSAYQRVQPLTIGELWAVATMLRLVLVDAALRYRVPAPVGIYEIAVENPDGVSHGVSRIALDGKALQTGDAQIPRADDGATHQVEVVLGG